MNLDIIRLRNETEYLLLSVTKIFETLIEQNQTNPQKKLEFKLTEPRDTCSSKPFINFGLGCTWMIGLTSLEV